MAYVDELLGHGEQILYTAKPHTIMLVSRTLSGMLLIAILVAAGVASSRAFGFYTAVELAGFSFTIDGDLILQIMFALSVLVLLSILSTFLRWNAESYVLTDRRVLQLRGVLGKTVIDSSLGRINDVSMRQSMLGRMLNFGTIEIWTSADEANNSMDNIRAPLDFKRAMLEAKYHYDRGYGYLDDPPLSSTTLEQPLRAEFELQRTLEELASLRDRGILSPEEYEAKRTELLTRL
jgi:membrane protein YdbS with pleckstrin-like domain